MGGDFAPDSNIDGAIEAKPGLGDKVDIVLIGDQSAIEKRFAAQGADLSNFEVLHTTETIGMGEHPTRAFTKKPKSSIALGFDLLKKGEVDAFASVGNTGAMLVGSMYTVKSIPGVIRPGITTILPKESGSVGILLDVGTNADCKPDVLYQFAILGSLYASHVYKIKSPKVGLLNIGEEEEKGNLLAQATHALMKDTRDFKFIGNVEGRDLFNNKADVIVCDGFTGNIVLKEIEAFYSMIKKRGIDDEYFNRFNYELYGGTPILGINSSVVIGHGISNYIAIKNMLYLTRDVVNSRLSDKIKNAFN